MSKMFVTYLGTTKHEWSIDDDDDDGDGDGDEVVG